MIYKDENCYVIFNFYNYKLLIYTILNNIIIFKNT